MPLGDGLRRKLRRSAQLHAKWREERDMLIRAANEQGASLREIGALVGLSHVSVLKITRKAHRHD